MHYAVCRVVDAKAAAPLFSSQLSLTRSGGGAGDTRWLKFGDRYFAYGPDRPPSLPSSLTAGVELVAEREFEHISDKSLYLVVQKGRRFQDQHPDAPVLFNAGRYLVVSLSGPLLQHVRALEGPNYAVKPAIGNEIVYDACPAPSARPAPVPAFRALVEGISGLGLRAHTITLASHLTRNSITRRFREAAGWAAETLAAMGYEVTLSEFNVPRTQLHPGGRSLNVAAEKGGGRTGDRALVLVVAHLDSVNWRAPPSEQTTASAPGADDNASGAAGLMAIARVFKDVALAEDVRFVLFGGEEQGLLGSQYYVEHMPIDDRTRTVVAINMDMIAKVRRRPRTVLLEGGPVSKQFVEELAGAAHTYTDLRVVTSMNPYNSDHVSFLAKGIPAVLTIEGSDEEEHSAADTLDLLDYDLALQILRMNTAFVAEKAGAHPATGN